MKKFLKSFRYGEKGFTLIELLIVLAILGAMAGAIIPNLKKFTETGTKSACLNEAQIIQTAVDAAMADSGISSLSAATTIGPGAVGPATWEVTDGDNIGYAGEFINRTIKGTYSVSDVSGLVTVTTYPGLDPATITEINNKLSPP